MDGFGIFEGNHSTETDIKPQV
ncbi:hypothetical protein CY0110_19322 [Crocosphaera chwakensis CCY0110]|uniref:Uncharacterized protein n=1 Tax=Crocosphaera chwakensis CCY0110 TaxID=391612 RepID=A3IJJ6_9CHRO|nr:hypothetical protein CY0110_19322 [Crocosphaera chwakensis CCY0110]